MDDILVQDDDEQPKVLQRATRFLGSVLSRLDGSFNDSVGELTEQDVADGWKRHLGEWIHNPGNHPLKESIELCEDNRGYYCQVAGCPKKRRAGFLRPFCIAHGGFEGQEEIL